MADARVFKLPLDNVDRHHKIVQRIDILQFNHSGDLLANVDSDHVLRIYSISQNTYVLRRYFEREITTIAFKSDMYGEFFGRSSIFVGFDNGSIILLTFPFSVYDVMTSTRLPETFTNIRILFQHDTRTVEFDDGPRARVDCIAQRDDRFISGSGAGVTFWKEFGELIPICCHFPVSNQIDNWEFDKTMDLSKLCSDTSSNIANIIWKDWDSCFVIFQTSCIV